MARPPRLGFLIRFIEEAIDDSREATAEWREWMKSDNRVPPQVLASVLAKIKAADQSLDDAWQEWVAAFQRERG